MFVTMCGRVRRVKSRSMLTRSTTVNSRKLVPGSCEFFDSVVAEKSDFS